MSFKEALVEAWYDKLKISSTSELKIIRQLFQDIRDKHIDISDVDYLYFYIMKCEGEETDAYSIDFAYREVGEDESFLNLSPIGSFGHMNEKVANSNFFVLKEKIKEERFAVNDYVFKELGIKIFRVDLEDFRDEIPNI